MASAPNEAENAKREAERTEVRVSMPTVAIDRDRATAAEPAPRAKIEARNI